HQPHQPGLPARPPRAGIRAMSRFRRWAPRVAAAVALVAVLSADASPLGPAALVFVLVVPFEKLFPRHRQRLRRRAVGTDLAYALTSGPLGLIGIVVGLVVSVLSLAWVPGLLLRPLVLGMPPVPRAMLGVLLFDLAACWVHRFSHEVFLLKNSTPGATSCGRSAGLRPATRSSTRRWLAVCSPGSPDGAHRQPTRARSIVSASASAMSSRRSHAA
ncbi:MAG: hypothetical protein ACRDZN_06230, partial [Acidimicrobiales bacterium]